MTAWPHTRISLLNLRRGTKPTWRDHSDDMCHPPIRSWRVRHADSPDAMLVEVLTVFNTDSSKPTNVISSDATRTPRSLVIRQGEQVGLTATTISVISTADHPHPLVYSGSRCDLEDLELLRRGVFHAHGYTPW